MPLLSYMPWIGHFPFAKAAIRVLINGFAASNNHEKDLSYGEKGLYVLMFLAFWKYKAASLAAFMIYHGAYSLYNVHMLLEQQLPLQALCDAVIAGDDSEVLEILEDKDVNIKEYCLTGDTPLLNAIYYDHALVVDLLLAAGSDINKPSDVSNFSAVEHLFVGKYLFLENGKIEVQSGHKINTKILRILLSKKPDLVAPAKAGYHALGTVMAAGDTKTALLLIKEGSLINVPFNDIPLLFYAINHLMEEEELAMVNHPETNFIVSEYLKLAIDKGLSDVALAIVNHPKTYSIRDSYLKLAMKNEMSDVALALVKRKVGINASFKGKPSLFFAIERKNTKVAIALIKADAKVDSIYDGQTALHYAFKYKLEKVAIRLVAAGANLDININGSPLLFAAISDGWTKLPLRLIAQPKRVDINQGVDGQTPLHASILRQNEEVSTALIDAGTDIDRVYKNITFLSYSIMSKKEKIALELINRGADVNAASEFNGAIIPPLLQSVLINLTDVSVRLFQHPATSLNVAVNYTDAALASNNTADILSVLVKESANTKIIEAFLIRSIGDFYRERHNTIDNVQDEKSTVNNEADTSKVPATQDIAGQVEEDQGGWWWF